MDRQREKVRIIHDMQNIIRTLQQLEDLPETDADYTILDVTASKLKEAITKFNHFLEENQHEN